MTEEIQDNASQGEVEAALFEQLKEKGFDAETFSWKTCRTWLDQADWKINSLSDYPRGEIKFAIRKGFERIAVQGFSDLEVMGKAILEVMRRKEIHS